jgi:hypothetical protein
MAAGAFVIDPNHGGDNFNLRPLGNTDIPGEQRRIQHEVYEARNILKFLREQNVFRDDSSYAEFINRVLQAARAGCVGQHVDTTMASDALEQIRSDVVRRKGRIIAYRYLLGLAKTALAGMAFAVLVILASKYLVPGLKGYGWVIMGAMAGAWISSAATGREISFAGIQDFLDYGHAPLIRMLFVGALASVLALFLQLRFITLKIGTVDLADFSTQLTVALALGVIAGFSEKALSVQLIDRARRVLTPGAP